MAFYINPPIYYLPGGGNSLAGPEVVLNMTRLEPSTVILVSAPEARAMPLPQVIGYYSPECSSRWCLRVLPHLLWLYWSWVQQKARRNFRGKMQPTFVVLFHKKKGLRKSLQVERERERTRSGAWCCDLHEGRGERHSGHRASVSTTWELKGGLETHV